MFYTKYSISLAITILNIFLFRKDSIFSPFKFMIIINTLYILFPLTLFGIFDYNIEVFGNIFPSLFSDSTNSYMLNMYICFNIIILLVRFLFQKNKVNFYFINNTDHQRKDANLAFTSILFLIIGLFFIIISILLVGGLDVYRSYSIGATVGGDVVAQSFKSQGELMLGIFSLPLIKYFYKERKIALLSFLLIFLVSLSLLGGARKFLVFPFGFLLLLYLIDNKVSLERLFKFDDKSFLKRMLKICSLIVFFLVALALIQNVRDGLGFVIDLKSIEKTIVHQFGFAYLVPNAFIYHNYEVLTQLNFSIIDFFRLLFNAVVFCIPRFMYPNKENLLFSNTQSFKTDFHTVGGSSFIEYFLTNSIYSVILFYFLLCLLIGYVFNLNQKKENPVYLYLYFSSLIILIWFNYNWGYVFVTKTFIIQIVLTIWFYYYVSILLEKIFSRNEVSILLEKVFSRNKLDS